jgi:hypothetical protein
MAEIRIRLIFNRKSGKKDIFIDYESEDDALPIEHERAHREIVGKLLGQGILRPDETGEIIVGRVQPGTAAGPVREHPPAPEAQPQTGG